MAATAAGEDGGDQQAGRRARELDVSSMGGGSARMRRDV
jgi:hypothetical protein